MIKKFVPTKPKKRKLKIWTMTDIEQFKPNPNLYVVGDGHIMRGRDRLHLITGYAGVGKSRAANYLAFCGATGRRWFDYDVKSPFKTLIIQNENGPIRLNADYSDHFEEIRDKIIYVDLPTGNQFNEEWFRDELREIIEQESIGVVVIDPWTNVAPDLNHKEFNKAIEQVLSCMPEDDEKCPAIVVIAHLRKPSGQGKRKQGMELMHEVMGSQTLTSRSRFVLVMERVNPSDRNDDRIVVTCAKNNDSPHAPRSCHRRGKVIFDPVEDFDWDQYDQGGKPGANPLYTLSDIVDLVSPSEEVTSAEWKKRAIDIYGISSSRFYDFQSEATSKERVIKVGKGVYRRPAA